jgi:hypothetical protein
VRQHARQESLSKRAPSTTRTSLQFGINELRATFSDYRTRPQLSSAPRITFALGDDTSEPWRNPRRRDEEEDAVKVRCFGCDALIEADSSDAVYCLEPHLPAIPEYPERA